MASKKFPEVTVDVDGRSYTLVLDINAMAALEDRLSTADAEVSFQDVANKAIRGSVRHARAICWAALIRHQPTTTLEQAGDFMAALDAVGPSGHLAELMGQATPDPEDVKALGVKSKRPRKARAA